MAIFFTSDQHFAHINIMKYEKDNRVDLNGNSFNSIDDMDYYIIDRWNEKITPEDTVYLLGDTSFKEQVIRNYLHSLNGNIELVCGNHDPYFKNFFYGSAGLVNDVIYRAKNAGFNNIHKKINLNIEGLGRVKMSHFPFISKNENPEYSRYLDLRPKDDGCDILLHGHVHSKWKIAYSNKGTPMVNVGVDFWGLSPVGLEEIIKLVKAKV